MVSVNAKSGLAGLLTVSICIGLIWAAEPTEQFRSKTKSMERGEKDVPGELSDAKARVSSRFQKRLNAALEAMIQCHQGRMPVTIIEAMANAGLDRGLNAGEFDSLAKFALARQASGLSDENLLKAIHAEIDRREAMSKKAQSARKSDKGKSVRSEFGGLGGNAHHVVYLIDRSGSMFDTFDWVRKVIADSVKKLGSQQDFHVIMFNDETPLEKKPMTLTPATAEHKLALSTFLETVRPYGKTNPIKAVNRAFEVLSKSNKRPGKIIYMLTDGAFPNSKAVLDVIRKKNVRKGVTINTFMCGWKSAEGVKTMRQIAKENGGRYRYVSPDE